MNAPNSDEKAKEIELNDFHKAWNKRMVRKVSEQPLRSPEEFIEQTRRLAQQSKRSVAKSGE